MSRTAAAPARPRDWIALAILMLPTLLLSLDLSVLFVALPTLSARLHADSVQQLWITNIYAFMVSGFLVTMGKLGDSVGRRRLLLIGAIAFAAASTAAAFATSPALLIAGRAAMGIAGATLAPSTSALITNMFLDDRQRTLAFSIWGTSFMTGAAVGPLIGGVLLERFWWGAPFLLAIPVALVLVIAGPLVVPEFRAPGRSRLDLLSMLLSLATILPVVYGIQELGRGGTLRASLAVCVGGIFFGTCFVKRQLRLEDPLVDLSLFRNRKVAVALATIAIGPASQAGLMLLVVLYLQSVRGLSPVATGLWEAPSSLAQAVGALAAPFIIRRLPPRRLMSLSLAVSSLGCLLIALGRSDTTTAVMMAGTIVLFVSFGSAQVISNVLIMGSVPSRRAGSASALSETAGNLGMGSGTAILGTIGALIFHAVMRAHTGSQPDNIGRITSGGIAGIQASLRGIPHQHADQLLAAAATAFGMALAVAAICCCVVLAALTIVSRRAFRSRTAQRDANQPIAEFAMSPASRTADQPTVATASAAIDRASGLTRLRS